MCSRRLALKKEERQDVIMEEQHNFHTPVHNLERPVSNPDAQVHNPDTAVNDLDAPVHELHNSVDELRGLHNPCGNERVIFGWGWVSQSGLLRGNEPTLMVDSGLSSFSLRERVDIS